MVLRRKFIGSVIGTVLGVPFVAESIPINIPQYKLAFREARTGEIIMAPGMKAIHKTAKGFEFVAEDLIVNRTLTMRGCLLYDKQGRFIKEGKFAADVPMCSGDILKATYTLSSNREFENVDDLITKFREHNAALSRAKKNS